MEGDSTRVLRIESLGFGHVLIRDLTARGVKGEHKAAKIKTINRACGTRGLGILSSTASFAFSLEQARAFRRLVRDVCTSYGV